MGIPRRLAAGNGETPVALGTVTAKHRVVGSYDFVLSDASPSTATVIVTKLGATATAATSGVEGKVTIGPSCPVARTPPDPSCADRPAAATFSIDTTTGVHVADASSGVDGRFSLTLRPGTYIISLRATSVMPTMAPQTFSVPDNGITTLSLQLDSGIR